MKALLRIVSGTKEKGVVDLETGSYTIGRDEKAEIRINSRQVSRNHAKIVVDKNHVRFIDSGSANGSLLNGKPFLNGPLYDGDQIQVGDVTFEYEPKRSAEIAALKPAEKDALTVLRTQSRKTIGGKKVKPQTIKTWIALGLATLLIGTTLFIGFSFRSLLSHRLYAESLRLAAQSVRFLAEKNRADLSAGNDLLVEIDSIKKEKGEKEVGVINPKGKITPPF